MCVIKITINLAVGLAVIEVTLGKSLATTYKLYIIEIERDEIPVLAWLTFNKSIHLFRYTRFRCFILWRTE